MSELKNRLDENYRRMTDGEREAAKRNRLLNEVNVNLIKQHEAQLDQLTTALFKNLIHDDTGRYSDDGVHFNAVGSERQEILLAACTLIKQAMDLLKIL